MNNIQSQQIQAAPEKCPASGLKIVQKEEWRNVDFGNGSNYRISIQLIGDRILMVQSSGFGSLEDLSKALDFTQGIVNEHIPIDGKYVRIEDLETFKGISNDARAHYASVMRNLEPLMGLIYFNAPYMIRTSIQLGKRFGLVKFDVDLAQSYFDSIRMALRIIDKNNRKASSG